MKKSRSCVQLSKSGQKLDIILENEVLRKYNLTKNVNNKKSVPTMIFIYEKQIQKDSNHF